MLSDEIDEVRMTVACSNLLPQWGWIGNLILLQYVATCYYCRNREATERAATCYNMLNYPHQYIQYSLLKITTFLSRWLGDYFIPRYTLNTRINGYPLSSYCCYCCGKASNKLHGRPFLTLKCLSFERDLFEYLGYFTFC